MTHATSIQAVDTPDKLREIIDAVRAYEWQDAAWSLVVIIAALVVGRIFAALCFRALARWARRTETVVDDAIAKHLPRPLRWLLPLVVLNFAMPLVALSDSTIASLRQALLVAAIVAGGWMGMRVIRVVEDVIQSKLDLGAADNLRDRQIATQTRAFRNIAAFVVAVLTVGFALMTFEAVRQVGSALLASAGVAGLVIGFAAQRSIAALLAGVQIAITQPIRVDDVVIVEGEWGRIEEITLTYVVVRIWDMRRLIVPVSYFIEKPFQNWTRVSAELLGTVELHLDYSVPVDEIRAEFKRILEASEAWDKKSWSVQVTAASDRTMTVRPLFSAKNSGDQWNLRCEVREKLLAWLKERYPHALPRLRAEVEQHAA